MAISFFFVAVVAVAVAATTSSKTNENSFSFDEAIVVEKACIRNAVPIAIDEVLLNCALTTPFTTKRQEGTTTRSENTEQDDEKFDDETTRGGNPRQTTQNGYKMSPKILGPLDKLQLDLDRNRMMHRLAARYFEFQNFWVLFVPSIAITTLSGILAALSDSAGFQEAAVVGNWLDIPAQVKGLFSTLVGILSIVSVSFQAMNKELDYSHRAKEHEGVAMELRNLYDKIKFQELLLVNDDVDDDNTSDVLTETVRLYEEKYEQVMTGCISPLPTEIYNAYELASSRMELYIFPPVLVMADEDDDSRHSRVSRTRIDWSSVMGIVNNEVFNAIEKSKWWPMHMPSAEPIVDAAFDSIFHLLTKDQEYTTTKDASTKAHKNEEPTSVYRLLLEQQKSIQTVNGQLRDEEVPPEKSTLAEEL